LYSNGRCQLEGTRVQASNQEVAAATCEMWRCGAGYLLLFPDDCQQITKDECDSCHGNDLNEASRVWWIGLEHGAEVQKGINLTAIHHPALYR